MYNIMSVAVASQIDFMKNFKFTPLSVGCMLTFFAVIGIVLCHWYAANYYAGFEEIYVTLTTPLKGSDTTAVKKGACEILPPALMYYGLFLLIVFTAKHLVPESFDKALGYSVLAASVLMIFFVLSYADKKLSAVEYMTLKTQKTDLYDKYYINPDDVEITAPEQKKNVILLYLESTENTYADKQSGGKQDINYIPYLTQLATEQENFTETGGLGGFHNTYGSTWTAGALFSSTTGIPYHTSLKRGDQIAPDLTGLYDVLEQNGYRQYYLCGSDAYFGGRSDYYKSHGNTEIYDLNTAKSDGYIDEDYHVWWGYEDEKLYRIAKDKILTAASKDEPFSFTMLTVDTHFPGGYTCGLCKDKYTNRIGNVVACADSQVGHFIEWCKNQDFYKDTVIVVMGDHPRMDRVFPAELSSYDRTTYLTFVNSAVRREQKYNRLYTQLDIFPTTLAAIGFSIEGDRLALGTNLFSNEHTLAETMSYDTLNRECAKGSDYLDKFM